MAFSLVNFYINVFILLHQIQIIFLFYFNFILNSQFATHLLKVCMQQQILVRMQQQFKPNQFIKQIQAAETPIRNTMAFVADKDFKIRKDISDLRHKLDPPIGVGRHASYGTSPVNKPSAPTNFQYNSGIKQARPHKSNAVYFTQTPHAFTSAQNKRQAVEVPEEVDEIMNQLKSQLIYYRQESEQLRLMIQEKDNSAKQVIIKLEKDIEVLISQNDRIRSLQQRAIKEQHDQRKAISPSSALPCQKCIQLQLKLNGLQQQLQKEAERYQNELKIKDEEIQKNKRFRVDLSERIQRMEQQLRQSEKEMRKIEKENVELSKRLSKFKEKDAQNIEKNNQLMQSYNILNSDKERILLEYTEECQKLMQQEQEFNYLINRIEDINYHLEGYQGGRSIVSKREQIELESMMEELQNKIQDLHTKFTEKTIETNQLEAKLIEKDSHFRRLSDQYSDIIEKIDHYEDEQSTYKQKIQQLEREIQKLRQSQIIVNPANEELVLKNQRMYAQLKLQINKNEDLILELGQKDLSIGHLHQQLQKSQYYIENTLKKTLEENNQTIRQLTNENESLDSRIKEMIFIHESNADREDHFKEAQTPSTIKIQLLEAEREDMRRKIYEYEQLITEIQSKGLPNNEKRGDLFDNDQKDKQGAKSQLTQQNTNLRGQLNVARKRIEELQYNLNQEELSNEREGRQLERTILNIKNENMNLINQNQEVNYNLKNAEAFIANQIEREKALEMQIGNMVISHQQTVSILQNQRQEALKQVQQAEIQRNQHCRDMNYIVESYDKKVSNLNQKLEVEIQTRLDVQKDNKQIMRQLSQQALTIEKQEIIQSQSQELLNQLSRAQRQVQNLQQRNTQLTTNQASIKKNIAMLEQSLQEQKLQNQDIYQQFSTLKDQLAQANWNNQTLTQQIGRLQQQWKYTSDQLSNISHKRQEEHQELVKRRTEQANLKYQVEERQARLREVWHQNQQLKSALKDKEFQQSQRDNYSPMSLTLSQSINESIRLLQRDVAGKDHQIDKTPEGQQVARKLEYIDRIGQKLNEGEVIVLKNQIRELQLNDQNLREQIAYLTAQMAENDEIVKHSAQIIHQNNEIAHQRSTLVQRLAFLEEYSQKIQQQNRDLQEELSRNAEISAVIKDCDEKLAKMDMYIRNEEIRFREQVQLLDGQREEERKMFELSVRQWQTKQQEILEQTNFYKSKLIQSQQSIGQLMTQREKLISQLALSANQLQNNSLKETQSIQSIERQLKLVIQQNKQCQNDMILIQRVKDELVIENQSLKKQIECTILVSNDNASLRQQILDLQKHFQEEVTHREEQIKKYIRNMEQSLNKMENQKNIIQQKLNQSLQQEIQTKNQRQFFKNKLQQAETYLMELQSGRRKAHIEANVTDFLLMNQNSALKQQIQKLNAQIRKLLDDNKDLNGQIEQRDHQNRQLAQKVKNLERKTQYYDKQIKLVQEQKVRIQLKYSQISQTLEETIFTLNTKISQLRKQMGPAALSSPSIITKIRDLQELVDKVTTEANYFKTKLREAQQFIDRLSRPKRLVSQGMGALTPRQNHLTQNQIQILNLKADKLQFDRKIKDINEQMGKYQQTSRALKQQIYQSENKLKSVAQKERLAEVQVAEAVNRLKDANKEIVFLQSKLGQAEDYIFHLQKTSTERNQMSILPTDNSTIDYLKGQNAGLKQQIIVKDNQIRRLQKEKSISQIALEQNNLLIKQLERNGSEYLLKVKELEQQIISMDREKEDIDIQFTAVKERNVLIQDSLAVDRSQLRKMEIQIATLKQNKTLDEQKIMQAQQIVQKLQISLDFFKTKLDEAERYISQMENQNIIERKKASTSSDAVRDTAILTNLQQNLQVYKLTVSQQQKQIIGLQSDNKKTETQCQQYKKQVTESFTQIVSLKDKLDDAEKYLSAKSQLQEQKNQIILQSEKRVKQLTQERAEIYNSWENIKFQLINAQQSIQRLQLDKNQIEFQFKDAEAKLSRLERDKRQSEQRANYSQNLLIENVNKISQLQNELRQAEIYIDSLQKQKQTFKQQQNINTKSRQSQETTSQSDAGNSLQKQKEIFEQIIREKESIISNMQQSLIKKERKSYPNGSAQFFRSKLEEAEDYISQMQQENSEVSNAFLYLQQSTLKLNEEIAKLNQKLINSDSDKDILIAENMQMQNQITDLQLKNQLLDRTIEQLKNSSEQQLRLAKEQLQLMKVKLVSAQTVQIERDNINQLRISESQRHQNAIVVLQSKLKENEKEKEVLIQLSIAADQKIGSLTTELNFFKQKLREAEEYILQIESIKEPSVEPNTEGLQITGKQIQLISLLKNQISQLLISNNHLLEEKATTELKNSNKIRIIQELEERIESINRKIEMIQTEVDHYKKQLSLLEIKVQQSDSIDSSLKQSLIAKDDCIQQKEREIQFFKEKLFEAEEFITGLQKQNDDLIMQIQSLSQNITSLSTEIANLKDKIVKSDRNSMSLLSEIEEKSYQNQVLRKQISNFSDSRSIEVNQEISSFKEVVEQLESQLAYERQNHKNDIDYLTNELNQTQGLKQQIQMDKLFAEEQLAQLQIQLQNIKKNAGRTKLPTITQEQADEPIQFFKSKLHQAQNYVLQLQEENDTIRLAIQSLQDRVASLSVEVARLNDKLVTTTLGNELLLKQIEQLKNTNQRQKESNQQLVSSMQKQIDELHLQLEQYMIQNNKQGLQTIQKFDTQKDKRQKQGQLQRYYNDQMSSIIKELQNQNGNLAEENEINLNKVKLLQEVITQLKNELAYEKRDKLGEQFEYALSQESSPKMVKRPVEDQDIHEFFSVKLLQAQKYITELQEQKQSVANAVDVLNKQAEILRQEISQLKDKVVIIDADKVSLLKASEQMKNENQELRFKLHCKQLEEPQLIKAATRDVRQLQAVLKQLQADKARQLQQKQNYEQIIKDYEYVHNDLDTKLVRMKDTQLELQNQVKALSRQSQDLRAQLQQAIKKTEENNKKSLLYSFNPKLQYPANHITDLEEERISLISQNQDLKNSVNMLISEVIDLKQHSSKLQILNETLKPEIDSLKNDKELMESDLAKLHSKLAYLESLHESKDQEISELRILNDISRDAEELRKSKARMENVLDGLSQKHDEPMKQSHLKDDQSNLLLQKQMQIQLLNLQLQKREQQNRQLKVQNLNLREQLRQFLSNSQNINGNQIIQQLQHHLVESQRLNLQLKIQIQKQAKDKIQLESETNRLQSQYDEMEANMKQKQIKLQALQALIEETNTKSKVMEEFGSQIGDQFQRPGESAFYFQASKRSSIIIEQKLKDSIRKFTDMTNHFTENKEAQQAIIDQLEDFPYLQELIRSILYRLYISDERDLQKNLIIKNLTNQLKNQKKEEYIKVEEEKSLPSEIQSLLRENEQKQLYFDELALQNEKLSWKVRQLQEKSAEDDAEKIELINRLKKTDQKVSGLIVAEEKLQKESEQLYERKEILEQSLEHSKQRINQLEESMEKERQIEIQIRKIIDVTDRFSQVLDEEEILQNLQSYPCLNELVRSVFYKLRLSSALSLQKELKLQMLTSQVQSLRKEHLHPMEQKSFRLSTPRREEILYELAEYEALNKELEEKLQAVTMDFNLQGEILREYQKQLDESKSQLGQESLEQVDKMQQPMDNSSSINTKDLAYLQLLTSCIDKIIDIQQAVDQIEREITQIAPLEGANLSQQSSDNHSSESNLIGRLQELQERLNRQESDVREQQQESHRLDTELTDLLKNLSVNAELPPAIRMQIDEYLTHLQGQIAKEHDRHFGETDKLRQQIKYIGGNKQLKREREEVLGKESPDRNANDLLREITGLNHAVEIYHLQSYRRRQHYKSTIEGLLLLLQELRQLYDQLSIDNGYQPIIEVCQQMDQLGKLMKNALQNEEEEEESNQIQLNAGKDFILSGNYTQMLEVNREKKGKNRFEALMRLQESVGEYIERHFESRQTQTEQINKLGRNNALSYDQIVQDIDERRQWYYEAPTQLSDEVFNHLISLLPLVQGDQTFYNCIDSLFSTLYRIEVSFETALHQKDEVVRTHNQKMSRILNRTPSEHSEEILNAFEGRGEEIQDQRLQVQTERKAHPQGNGDPTFAREM